MTPADLKTIRKSLALTTRQLADALGVSRSIVTKWEAGARPISQVVEMALKALERFHREAFCEVAAVSPKAVRMLKERARSR
ncbi:MAG: helix-turn-helix domain-containing protein [Bradyrhizobium sp.]